MSDDRTMSQRVDALWCSLDDQLAHHSDDDPPPMTMCRIALEAAGLPDLLERVEGDDIPVRGTNIKCPDCGRHLGDVVASLIRQRGRFKAQRNRAQVHLAAAQAAADEWKMQANAMAKALGPVQDDWRDAQAAAKDFAFALHMLDVAGMPGVTGVKELLAEHPEFAPDKDGAS